MPHLLKGIQLVLVSQYQDFGKKNPVVAKNDKYTSKPNSRQIKKITSSSKDQLYKGTLVELKENNFFVRKLIFQMMNTMKYFFNYICSNKI